MTGDVIAVVIATIAAFPSTFRMKSADRPLWTADATEAGIERKCDVTFGPPDDYFDDWTPANWAQIQSFMRTQAVIEGIVTATRVGYTGDADIPATVVQLTRRDGGGTAYLLLMTGAVIADGKRRCTADASLAAVPRPGDIVLALVTHTIDDRGSLYQVSGSNMFIDRAWHLIVPPKLRDVPPEIRLFDDLKRALGIGGHTGLLVRH